MYKLLTTSIILSIAAIGQIANGQTAIDNKNIITPNPETPVWKSERDLLVLFEDSNDRIGLATQIMSLCFNNNAILSNQQRYDGLKIAGHTLAQEREHENAIACFDGAISLNISDDDTADSYRMKAQSHFWLGEHQFAKEAYLICYNMSKQIEAVEGYNNLSSLVTIMLIKTAQLSGDSLLAYDIANAAIANPDTTPYMRSTVMDRASITAIEAGDNIVAEQYLLQLLNEYPEYGIEFPGAQVNLRIRLLEAQGVLIEDFNPAAIQAVLEIVQDQRFIGMPAWAGAVSRLAGMLEASNDYARANKLRLWAVDQFDIKKNALDTNAPDAQVKIIAFQNVKLGILQRAERAFYHAGMTEEQEEILIRLGSEYSSNQKLMSFVNLMLNDIEIKRASGLQQIP